MSADHPTPLRTWLSTLPALLLLLFAVAHGTAETVSGRLLGLGEQQWPGYAEVRFDPEAPDCDPASFDARTAPAQPGQPADPLADLFGNGAPQAAPSDAGDLTSGLFGNPSAATDAPSAAAMMAAKRDCEQRHARYAELIAMITPELQAWRAVDTSLAALSETGRVWMQPLLVALLLLCGATATATGAHISLRSPTHALDQRFADGVQLVTHLLAALSALARYDIIQTSGMTVTFPWVPLLWATGFFVIAGINVWRLVRPPEDLIAGGHPLRAAGAIPLHATLGIFASIWFLLGENHPAGLNIYLDKLTEQSGLYIQVGLYVWAGMLLKNTRIADRSFDVLRPWNLPAELLAAVVVVVASVPVAYSGASGIFVIAAGSTIYNELRRAGARRQLALAATAMSGSLGVVLSPCLLVVVVAALNKSVTSDALFDVGRSVFLLTAALFTGTMMARRQQPWRLLSTSQAMAGSQAALYELIGYAVILAAVVLFYGAALDTWIDDHSAPVILLVAMLGMMLFEGQKDSTPAFPRLSASTRETTVHIGALLMLMAFSVGFGGIIERSEVMSLVPTDLGGPLPAMCVLVVALIIIGMLMDPYGAVILVSATLAHVAEQNGIHPAHFWMTVLVAFELGYLTPPVALNQLLTTSVVGRDAEIDDLPRDASFFDRHERYVLPVGVMGTALLIVAFGPLLS